MRLRVVAYNVHGFRQGIERVVRVVDRLRPDVLLMNETGGRMRLRRFARAVGMEVAGDPWSPLRRRVKDAVLVRPPWAVVEHRMHRFEEGSFLLPRGALVARLEREGLPLVAVATHLGLHPRERLENARELVSLLPERGGGVVLGGDLNAMPQERSVGVLAGRVHDAWLSAGEGEGATFPASAPTARIDYVFVSEGLVVDSADVPGDDDPRLASDHLPISVDLTLPERR